MSHSSSGRNRIRFDGIGVGVGIGVDTIPRDCVILFAHLSEADGCLLHNLCASVHELSNGWRVLLLAGIDEISIMIRELFLVPVFDLSPPKGSGCFRRSGPSLLLSWLLDVLWGVIFLGRIFVSRTRSRPLFPCSSGSSEPQEQMMRLRFRRF